MNAYTTTLPASAPGTDAGIASAIAALAAATGTRTGYIEPTAIYTPAMRAAGAALVEALGASPADAAALPDGEYTAYYAVARKNPASARRMAAKRFGAPSGTPTPATPSPVPTAPLPAADMEALKASLLAELSRQTATGLASIEAALLAANPRKVEVTVPGLPPVTVDHAHKVLPRVLRKAMERRAVYLVGGMGVGKTTLGKQIAKILKLPFYMAASVFEEHKLFGYLFGGEYITTDFRRCWEFGGVFLFDELDRSDPGVVVAFNAFTNGFLAFPDRLVERHPDCIVIAAGNTAMRGATREFNAAQKMDASVLDRYYMIEMELDLDLEASLCGNKAWLRYCRALRAETLKQSIDDLAVTPRAVVEGAEAIAKGDTWAEAADGLIWKGLATATRERLERAVPIATYATDGGIL